MGNTLRNEDEIELNRRLERDEEREPSFRRRQRIPVIRDVDLDADAGEMQPPKKEPAKIFVFCNGCSPGWHPFVALAETGEVLAAHLCSDHGFAAHDMGVDPNGWKREIYAERFPDGFVVEYVEIRSNADVEAHAELVEALAKNKAREVRS